MVSVINFLTKNETTGLEYTSSMEERIQSGEDYARWREITLMFLSYSVTDPVTNEIIALSACLEY